VAFSNIDLNNSYNNSDPELFGNKLIILKKVKSLRQLRRAEKELVRLNYKEAIIKGFTLKGIQQFIASKTKIWIEWSCLEQLKKSEEQENREWFYYMAHDHFAYVGAYRKCIDEISQYKKEIWNIVIDSKIDQTTRIQALKELRSLSKTYTLLIKDIPFVTNISKYYDKDIINSIYNNLSLHNNRIDNPNSKKKCLLENNQSVFADIEDSHITDTINSSDRVKDREEELTKTLRAQLNYNDDDLISQEHLETIKRLE
jgi:hypothetical protein